MIEAFAVSLFKDKRKTGLLPRERRAGNLARLRRNQRRPWDRRRPAGNSLAKTVATA
jgi:hypothetical protein